MSQPQNVYDVVVVGAGNAALCAAISAKEKGANVVVLERAPKEKRGGNSFFTDGAIRFAYQDMEAIRMVIPSISDEEAAKTIIPAYTSEEYYHDLKKVTGGKSDSTLASILVNSSYETITWMKEQGVTFELNADNQSFINEDGNRQFWGGLPVKTWNKGIGLVERLFHRAEQLGIEIRYNSRAIKLVTEDDKISYILVEQDNETVSVKTKSVVLACGSFEADKELRKEHIGQEWEAARVRGTEYNTGDGLSMAMSIGAQPFGDWAGCHSIGTDYNVPKVGDFTKPGDIFKKHSYPLGIMLNKEGNRFVDEGADFRNYTYAKYGREVLKQPGHVAYQIFDAKVRPLLRKEYNLEEATVYKANTLKDLVSQLDVKKEDFLQTIADYNEAVQDGNFDPTIKDGKATVGLDIDKTNWAQTIDQGPFYAFPVTCGITFSFGGVKISQAGEVLNGNDEPISGLYAAGEMVGGIFYDNYPGGSGLMSGAVFGKLSGASAAAYSLAQNVDSVL